MSEKNYIYLLIDPRNEQPFYVGQTINPDRRLKIHIWYRKTVNPKHPRLTPTQIRVEDICASEMKPILKVVAETWDYQKARQLEQKWMCDMTLQGHELTNQNSSVGTYGNFRDVLKNS